MMDERTLEWVHRRVRQRREFLAWAFDRYDEWGGPAAGRLGPHLGVGPRDLLRLGLALRPREGRFEQDARLIAADFGIDPFPLAAVARFVDAIAAMRGTSPAIGGGTQLPPTSGSGFLAAARARKPSKPRAPREPRKRRGTDGGER